MKLKLERFKMWATTHKVDLISAVAGLVVSGIILYLAIASNKAGSSPAVTAATGDVPTTPDSGTTSDSGTTDTGTTGTTAPPPASLASAVTTPLGNAASDVADVTGTDTTPSPNVSIVGRTLSPAPAKNIVQQNISSVAAAVAKAQPKAAAPAAVAKVVASAQTIVQHVTPQEQEALAKPTIKAEAKTTPAKVTPKKVATKLQPITRQLPTMSRL